MEASDAAAATVSLGGGAFRKGYESRVVSVFPGLLAGFCGNLCKLGALSHPPPCSSVCFLNVFTERGSECLIILSEQD